MPAHAKKRYGAGMVEVIWVHPNYIMVSNGEHKDQASVSLPEMELGAELTRKLYIRYVSCLVHETDQT